MGIDMPDGLPYQPWLAALVQQRTANQAIDDPHIRCQPDLFLRAYGLPHYLKFVRTPIFLVMLNEFNGIYRQVFSDGRALPKDPNPSWQGYSSATGPAIRWTSSRSDFATTSGFDWDGSVITEAAKVRERIRRPDFGRLEIEVTVDDPKAYSKTLEHHELHQQFAADTELIEQICVEGERFSRQLR